MSIDTLRSTPEREANIAIALQRCGAEVARGVVEALQTCLTCVHFTEATEVCALAKQRPPARVIAHGCDCHLDNIPF